MNESKAVPLETWGRAHFDPPPSLWTLRAMARAGKIEPQPVKVGKAYYVDPQARVVAPSQPSSPPNSRSDMSEHEWELDERLPRYDDLREFEVWLRSGAVRRVRRIGNRSAYLTPGLLVFTDCAHPMQNVVCDEDTVTGWRLSGRAAPPMPRSPDTPSLWRDLLGPTSTYDAEAHAAAYPGF